MVAAAADTDDQDDQQSQSDEEPEPEAVHGGYLHRAAVLRGAAGQVTQGDGLKLALA